MLPESLKKYLHPCDYATNATLFPLEAEHPNRVAKVAKIERDEICNYRIIDDSEEKECLPIFRAGASLPSHGSSHADITQAVVADSLGTTWNLEGLVPTAFRADTPEDYDSLFAVPPLRGGLWREQ